MTSLTAPRRVRTTAVVVSSAMLLGGCSFWAPNVAVEPYAPADGLQVELGNLRAVNMLVVSEGDGAPGVVVGALANRGFEDIEVTLEIGGTTTAVIDVPADVVVQLAGEDVVLPGVGPSAEEVVTVVVDEVDPIAGGVIDVRVINPDVGAATLRVPVMLPDAWYDDVLPSDL